MVAAAGVWAACGVARAQTAGPYRLEWSAPEACPTREAFETAVRERVGAPPFDANASRALTVAIRRDDTIWRARIGVRDGDAERGSQLLDSPSAECASVFSAAVAVASVMMQTPAAPTPAPKPADVKLEEAPERAPAARPRAKPGAPPADPPRPASPPLFFGIELAQDVVIHSEGDACRPGDDRFECYRHGTDTPFTGTPSDDTGNTAGGLLFGAQRLLLAAVWELAPRIALEARLGAAFGNVGPDFVPWHVEAGARYFLGAPNQELRGFVGASLGYAVVDAKLEVSVRDCAAASPGCADAEPTTVDAVERLGPGFAGGRLGLRWAFAQHHSVELALGALLTFPDVAAVLRPNLAYAVGF